MTRPLLRVTVIKPFEDNAGRVESPVPIVYRKAGDVIPSEDIARYHFRFLGHLKERGLVSIQKLTHCPTCGHELPATDDDATPALFNVAT